MLVSTFMEENVLHLSQEPLEFDLEEWHLPILSHRAMFPEVPPPFQKSGSQEA